MGPGGPGFTFMAVIAVAGLARAGQRRKASSEARSRVPHRQPPGPGGPRLAWLGRWTQPAGSGGGDPWPGRFLDPPPLVTRLMADALPERDARPLWTSWAAGAVLLPATAGLMAGPGTGLLVLAVCTFGPALFLRSRRGEARRQMEEAVPSAMESIARSLRTGASMHQAIAEAGRSTPGPLGPELAAVARRAGHGHTLAASLDRLAAVHGGTAIRVAVAALGLGIETGGAQAQAVDGVAATLRDRQAVAAELRALTSQARTSALVIGLAPLAFGAFAAATDPRTARFTLHTGLGLALVGTGLVLDACGWLWMRRLCR